MDGWVDRRIYRWTDGRIGGYIEGLIGGKEKEILC